MAPATLDWRTRIPAPAGAARAVGCVLVDSYDSGEQIGVGALAEVRVERGNIECVYITGGGHGRDRTARHALVASGLSGDSHAPQRTVVRHRIDLSAIIDAERRCP